MMRPVSLHHIGAAKGNKKMLKINIYFLHFKKFNAISKSTKSKSIHFKYLVQSSLKCPYQYLRKKILCPY